MGPEPVDGILAEGGMEGQHHGAGFTLRAQDPVELVTGIERGHEATHLGGDDACGLHDPSDLLEGFQVRTVERPVLSGHLDRIGLSPRAKDRVQSLFVGLVLPRQLAEVRVIRKGALRLQALGGLLQRGGLRLGELLPGGLGLAEPEKGCLRARGRLSSRLALLLAGGTGARAGAAFVRAKGLPALFGAEQRGVLPPLHFSLRRREAKAPAISGPAKMATPTAAAPASQIQVGTPRNDVFSTFLV